jgi:thimet oligopeptidase
MRHLWLAPYALLFACSKTPMTQPTPPLPPPDSARLLTGTLEAFGAACDADLERAFAQVNALKALDGRVQGPQVLAAYDEASAALSLASARSSLARETHPEAAFRNAARECEQKVDAASVEISLDRAVYDRLAAVDLAKEDEATRFWMSKTLLEFRRAGVDRDEATRKQVQALNEELTRLGQQFGKNIAEDVRKLELDPKELAGLPEDFVRAHPVGPNGKATLTTNYPDYFPFMTYAQSGKAREALWRLYRQRAHPQNLAVLEQLIAKRHQLATLLGYPSWAAYVTETKMTRTEKVAGEFIDKVAELAEERAKAELAQLLSRKRKDDPKAIAIEPWEFDYYQDRVKAESLGFDSQAVRPYFEYARVKQGVMDITARLFGVRYQKVEGATVWHPEVEGYDVLEGDRLLGRIYLDMHPREDKYKHAAQFDLAPGQAHKRYPEGVLVCNFPRPGELLTHDEVETFFHEFGHLLHHVFAGRQRWVGITGIRTEWDFVETPSMLLQEWASDPATLATFARHHQSDEPIPAALVERLRASKDFGKGLWTRRQMFLAAVSLRYYDRAPGFDTTQLLAELQQRYSPFRHEHRDGTYFQLAFGHLDGYSAIYYTYLWSVVIAKDLLQQFTAGGMLDADTAVRYRQAVLEPGGSKPAAELVKDFLGREYGFDAYRSWLEAG